MPQPILLLTSWNVYEPMEDIESFVQEAVEKETEHMHYGIALPYTALKELSHRHSYPHVRFGALHMNSIDKGSFTHSIAAKMLKMAGASFVLIGSDFERHVLKETDESLHMKLLEALKEGLTPILCVGETAEEHLAGKGESIIEAQLKAALAGVPKDQIEKVGIFFQAPWMKEMIHKPTVEEVTRSYDRDHAILGGIVGADAAERMQVIHTAPEDFEGFHPPANKGVFTFQHNVNKVYEHAIALQEQHKEEQAEAKLLETALEAESVLDAADVVSDETADAAAVERAIIETAAAADTAQEESEGVEVAEARSESQESADAAEVEQALIETAEAADVRFDEAVGGGDDPLNLDAGDISVPDALSQTAVPPVPGAADATSLPKTGKIRKDHKISDIN